MDEQINWLTALWSHRWPEILGVLSSLAAWAGWRQLEQQWAHERQILLERERHQQKLELEMVESAEKAQPSRIRAAAHAIRTLRNTGPVSTPPSRKDDDSAP